MSHILTCTHPSLPSPSRVLNAVQLEVSLLPRHERRGCASAQPSGKNPPSTFLGDRQIRANQYVENRWDLPIMHTRGSASISSSTASRRASHISFCCAVACILATRAATQGVLVNLLSPLAILFAGISLVMRAGVLRRLRHYNTDIHILFKFPDCSQPYTQPCALNAA